MALSGLIEKRQKIKEFFGHHAIGFFIALLVGICAGGSTFFMPLSIGNEYDGVQFIRNNDEDTYRARIQEILDGHYGVSSPNLYEYKDTSASLIPPIFEYFYAIPAMAIGLNAMLMLSKFLFPLILFLLIYFFVVKVLKREGNGDGTFEQWCAIAAGLLVLLGPDATNVGLIQNWLSGDMQYSRSLIWTRNVNPIIGGMLLFSFLLLYWRSSTTHWWERIAMGSILALSVGYFFSFGMIACIFAVSTILHAIQKNWKVLWGELSVWGIGFMLSLPYWIRALLSMRTHEGALLAQRTGLEYTHEPVINLFTLAMTLCIGALYFVASNFKVHKDFATVWRIIFTLCTASWLVYNQQIFTGRVVSFDHFPMYTVPVLFTAFMLAIYVTLVRKFPQYSKLIVGALVTCSLAMMSAYPFSAIQEKDNFTASQTVGRLFGFLNAHAPSDCVVLVVDEDDLIEQSISAYTHCNTYATTYVFVGVPRERILHNFLLRMRLNAIPEEGLHEYLLAHQGRVRMNFFDNWEQDFATTIDEWFLGRVAMIEEEYAKFMKQDLKKEILRYRTDYIISKNLLDEDVLVELGGLERIDSKGGYHMYVFR